MKRELDVGQAKEVLRKLDVMSWIEPVPSVRRVSVKYTANPDVYRVVAYLIDPVRTGSTLSRRSQARDAPNNRIAISGIVKRTAPLWIRMLQTPASLGV